MWMPVFTAASPEEITMEHYPPFFMRGPLSLAAWYSQAAALDFGPLADTLLLTITCVSWMSSKHSSLSKSRNLCNCILSGSVFYIEIDPTFDTMFQHPSQPSPPLSNLVIFIDP